MRHTSAWRGAAWMTLGVTITAGAATRAGAAAPATAPASEASAPRQMPPRPRIGLALSGGGARGLAHIGVLKWLEEHRIPVDALAGTSMGGLMGGLYAMGMSPDEIRDLVVDLDWAVIFRVRPPYEQLSYRRKEDQRTFANEIEMGLKKGLRLPSGINAGMEIGLLLDRLTLPYYSLRSFDELPVPFRCVGTDMERADAVVLGAGSLSTALRATMSIPGVFAPVEVDGKLLADGGLLDNLPVEVARSMGADVVLAVDVGTPLLTRDEIETIFGAVNQSMGAMMEQSIRRNRLLAHLVVTPELKGHSNLDFSQVAKVIDIGHAAAEASAESLSRYAVDEEEWQRYLAARAARRRTAVPVPDQLEITHAEGHAAAPVRQRGARFLGQPLDSDRLDHELREVVGDGRLASLGYGLAARGTSTALVLRPIEKTYAPPLLKLGLHLSNARPDTVDFSVFARVTFLDFGAERAEWRSDVRVGSSDLLATEYYRPLFGSRLFVAPQGFLGDEIQDLYEGDSRVAEYKVERKGIGVDAGYTLGRTGELRLGYELRRLDTSVTVGEGVRPEFGGRQSLVRARGTLDRQGSAVIPTHGLRLSGEVSWFFDSPGTEREFPRLNAEFSWFFPVRARSSLFVTGSGGTTFGRDPGPEDFTLGGPGRLSAYGPARFRGEDYLLGGTGYLHRLASLPVILGGNLYATVLAEVGSAFDGDLADARFRTSFTGGLMAETNFSALFLGGAVSTDGDANWFLSIGRRF